MTLGKRTHLGLIERLHCRGNFFLHKDHGQLHQIAQHHGWGNARSLNGQNLVDIQVSKTSNELYRHLLHQVGIHLMVHKAVNLQDAALHTPTILQNPVAQYFQCHNACLYNDNRWFSSRHPTVVQHCRQRHHGLGRTLHALLHPADSLCLFHHACMLCVQQTILFCYKSIAFK